MLNLIVPLVFLGKQTPTCCGSMAMFASDPAFLAAHPAPRAMHFVAGTGHDVQYQDSTGASTSGFYVPPKPGARAAVIMVHEWWGLNNFIRREAERLNDKEGYAVLAVDLYEGKVATTPQDAGKYMQGTSPDHAIAVLKGALSALESGRFGFKPRHIGTIGFCFGGGYSFKAAIEGGSHVQACEVFYGMPDLSADSMSRLKAPVLFIHPERDKWITGKVVDEFKSAMDAAGHKYTVRNYDADHAFANPSSASYNEADAQDAWAHAYKFFEEHL